MKHLYRFLLFICGVFLLEAFLPSKGFSQTLEQHISTDSLKVGDVFYFSIILKKDRAYDDVIYPDSSNFNGNFQLRSRKNYRIASFEDSVRYQLQFWGTANDTLPAMPVKLALNGDTTTLYTRPVIIHFHSVLKSKNAKFRPLKPIFAFAAVWWPYLAGFIGLIILIIIGYFLYQKYKKKPEPAAAPQFVAKPFLNPLKELENNLERLKDVPLNSREQFEQFYISLGDAIRLYFEQMYHIPAMESTSREIVYELDKRAIDKQLISQTRVVLREADMVKFAKFTPTEPNARKTYAKAEKFLSIAKRLHGARISKLQRQRLRRLKKHAKNLVNSKMRVSNRDLG